MGTSKKSADPSRAERKAKKRKLEEAIPDLPGDNDTAEDIVISSGTLDKAPKKRKKEHDETESMGSRMVSDKERRAAIKAKKEKKSQKKGEEITLKGVQVAEKVAKEDKKTRKQVNAESARIDTALETRDSEKLAQDEDAPKKSKKERKAERKAKEAADAAAIAAALPEPSEPTPGSKGGGTREEGNSKRNNREREKRRNAAGGQVTNGEVKAPRFIVFIGNLPFSANTKSIQKHFAAVKPKLVRALTQREDPTKSRGIAFVEFDGYDHMKTCLKMFHHSIFDDGISPPRKINIELTAGGGGNTKDRKEKIEGKNQKLSGERFRKIQEDEKAKREKKMNEGGKGPIDESAIHPSRRARVPGA